MQLLLHYIDSMLAVVLSANFQGRCEYVIGNNRKMDTYIKKTPPTTTEELQGIS